MALAGEYVDEADVNDLVDYVLLKAGAESVTSSTVVQSDDDIALTLTPGLWRVEAYLTASGATGGDIRVSWSNTGTMSFRARSCLGAAASVGAGAVTDTNMLDRAVAIGTEVIYGTDGSNSTFIMEDLAVEVTATGVLTMQWAQGSSSGTSTTLSTSTRAYIRKLQEWT